ncbi:MAG: hypothetical protein DCF30_22830 [Hyphomicrobiales bacterium]|nr:MAG: hypothetical protein DCF30_22830 [Hyphomicrobiales bacterium]
MGQVLQFRLPPAREQAPAGHALDLMSAVDFALRDLEAVREQAAACHQMLEAAYEAELEHG